MEENNVKVSVIIPVYNVEKYLRECMDSVVNQTLRDIEIICVDDGSTDNCPAILDEYAAKDERIKVIHKENGGLSSARNEGLKHISGEYVGFIDSDDWIDLNFYEKLYIAAIKNNADIAVASILGVENGVETKYYVKIKKEEIADKTKDKYKIANVPAKNYIMNRIYKCDKFINLNIPFEENRTYEDINWSPRIIHYMGRLVTVPDIKLYYRINSTSIVNTTQWGNLSNKKYVDWLYGSLKALQFITDEHIDTDLRNCNGFHCKTYKFAGLTLLNIYRFRNNRLYYLFGKILISKTINLKDDIKLLENTPTENEKNYKMIPVFQEKDSVNIVFTTDKSYLPYLYVAILSIIDNSSNKNHYDITVLHSNISVYRQNQFKLLEKENIVIRFLDISALTNKYGNNWLANYNNSNAIYYKFFIPEIYSQYDKILYLDSDIIVNFDIAELYNTDMKNYMVGAVSDLPNQQSCNIHEEYIEQVLGLKKDNYFNSGVLLFNLKNLNCNTFLSTCLENLKKLKASAFPLKNALNLLFKDNVQYLDYSYNLCWDMPNFWHDNSHELPQVTYKEYLNALKSPKIIHYRGVCKPWKQPWLAYSEYFWKYARLTPFYEEIIYKNTQIQPMNRDVIKNAVKRHRIYLQYLRCKILKALTFGKTKDHYQEKVKKLKLQVMDYRNTLE